MASTQGTRSRSIFCASLRDSASMAPRTDGVSHRPTQRDVGAYPQPGHTLRLTEHGEADAAG